MWGWREHMEPTGEEKLITIRINILGHLRELYPQLSEVSTVESESPITVSGIIRQLGISPRMVLFVTGNDRIIPKNTLIKGSCSLNLISPPAGG